MGVEVAPQIPTVSLVSNQEGSIWSGLETKYVFGFFFLTDIVQDLAIGRLGSAYKNNFIVFVCKLPKLFISIGYLPTNGIIGIDSNAVFTKYLIDFVKLISTLSRLTVEGHIFGKCGDIKLRNILKYYRFVIGLT